MKEETSEEEEKIRDERRDHMKKKRQDRRWKKRPECKEKREDETQDKRRSKRREEKRREEKRREEKRREEKRREEKRREEKRREEKRREEKRREEKRREEKRREEDKKREESRWREREREMKEKIFFKKNVPGHSNPPDELAQHVSKKKKSPVGRIIPPFFFRKFRIWPFLNYLQDSNSIFRAAGINWEGFSGRTVHTIDPLRHFSSSLGLSSAGVAPLPPFSRKFPVFSLVVVPSRWWRQLHVVRPVVRNGSGSPQRWGARWRRQGTIRKGFINSTEIVSATTPPRSTINITCNQVNFLRNHDGTKSLDELLGDAFFSWRRCCWYAGQHSKELLTTDCGSTKWGTWENPLQNPSLFTFDDLIWASLALCHEGR